MSIKYKVSLILLITFLNKVNAQSPAFRYIQNSEIDSLELFIQEGGDIDSRNEDAVPLVIYTIFAVKDSATRSLIIHQLVEAGCNLNITVGSDNWTSLLVAGKRQFWDLVEYFIENGADTKATTSVGKDIVYFLKTRCLADEYILELIKRKKVNINYQSTYDNENLIDIACDCNNEKLFEYTLEKQKEQEKLSILSKDNQYALYNRLLAKDGDLPKIYAQYDKDFRKNYKKLVKINTTNDFEFGQKLEKHNGKPTIFIFMCDDGSKCHSLIDDLLESRKIRRQLKKKYNTVWLSISSHEKVTPLEQKYYILKYPKQFAPYGISVPLETKNWLNWMILEEEFNKYHAPHLFIPSENKELFYRKEIDNILSIL